MPKLCEFENCRERARYGYPGSVVQRCKEHSIDNMRCNPGRVCKVEGCDKRPRSPTDFCRAHGGGKRCQVEGCDKSALPPTNFCKAHGGGKRCQVEGCDKGAVSPTDFCRAHGGGKRCQVEGCDTSAESPTIFCYSHGGNVRRLCKGLITGEACPYEHQGNRKYKNHCARCYQRNFPLDPLTFQIKCKTKEIAVRDFINANFTGFVHDKPIWTPHCDCTLRRRIDHRCLINNTMICIETDEYQHKSYDQQDEEYRYHDNFMGFSGKWIYIRFNPDRYIHNGVKHNPSMSKRLFILKNEISKQIERAQSYKNQQNLEVIHLFYDD